MNISLWGQEQMKALSNWWRRFPNEGSHWQFLDGYFKPVVTRLFVSWFALAPIVVGLISNFPDPLGLMLGNQEILIELALPFSWQILWFASLIYAIALAIHTLMCPAFIRRYPSYTPYMERGHSPRWLVWEIYYASLNLADREKKKLFGRLVDKGYAYEIAEDSHNALSAPTVGPAGTEWSFPYGEKSYRILIDEGFAEERQKDIFWEVMGRYASSLTPWRILTRALVYLSFALVLWTVIENILFVATYIISQ